MLFANHQSFMHFPLASISTITRAAYVHVIEATHDFSLDCYNDHLETRSSDYPPHGTTDFYRPFLLASVCNGHHR